ncbi:Hint domain-containing protein [Advenella kashmirensis]
MSTYTTSFTSALQLNEDNTFTVLAVSGSHSVATDSDDDGALTTGEEVTIDTDMNTNQLQAPIEGFHDDGYVVFADGGYVLFSNTSYEAGTTFPLETEDTGHPGLPVCFTKGTLIDTPEGPIRIENLKAGDSVNCSNGPRTVRWIGWRKCKLNSPRISTDERKKSAPVRIKQGALQNNIPATDLVVSPWHHIYLDGVLVRANDLVNDKTIAQELNLKQVEYFHIELDQFDVVLAHGVFSESWADGGNRNFFENVDVTSLRPEDTRRKLADRPGFTILRDRNEINKITSRLLERAELMKIGAKAA